MQDFELIVTDRDELPEGPPEPLPRDDSAALQWLSDRLDAEADTARQHGELYTADVLLMLAARLTDRDTFPAGGLVVEVAAGRTLMVQDPVAAAAVHTGDIGDIDAVATPMPAPSDPASAEIGTAALAALDTIGGVLEATPKGEPVADEHLNELLWAHETLDRRDPWQAHAADALHQAINARDRHRLAAIAALLNLNLP